MDSRYWHWLSKGVAIAHLVIIGLAAVSVARLVSEEPMHIWLPILIIMGSPKVGGFYCYLNRLENFCRVRAGLDPITDRVEALFKGR